MGYFNNSAVGITNEAPLLTQRIDSGSAHPELSEVQSRLERMRLEGSPLLDSSSSGGEGTSTAGSGHGKRKPKSSHKKPRSTSSLGYAESRYFIMKSLNEEDLKLSAQFGLWATQEHLVPILNDAFTVCVLLKMGCGMNTDDLYTLNLYDKRHSIVYVLVFILVIILLLSFRPIVRNRTPRMCTLYSVPIRAESSLAMLGKAILSSLIR